MEIAFTAADVQKWADFSGDYNPIHFEREKARLAGAEDVVVHGMLVLLPIKQALCDGLERAPAGGEWLRVKAWFRTPVPRERTQSVELKQRTPRRLEFRVAETAAGCERSRGFAERAGPPGGEREDSAGGLTLAAGADRLSTFERDFPYVKRLWIWLDAIAFAKFVTVHVADLMNEVCGADARRDPIGAGTGATVMQTSQEIVVSPRLVREPIGAARLDGCRYDVSLRTSVSSEDEVFGTVRISTWVGETLATRSDFGLLARRQAASAESRP